MTEVMALDEQQIKMPQQRQKIRMFFGSPLQVVDTVNEWVDKNTVSVIEQQMQIMEQTLIVSVLYVSHVKPAAATQTLPPAKGKQPLLNMGAIKAAYEQS